MKNHYLNFAKFLREHKEEILESWLKRVESDDNLKAPSLLARNQFYDHIPEILDHLLEEAKRLSDTTIPPFTFKEEFRLHGSQRWQQGFNLQEIVNDWNHLQHCLQDYVLRYSVEQLKDAPESATRISAFMSNLITMGVSTSTKQYDALRTTEALAHLKQLEIAKSDLERRIANNSSLVSATTHDLKGGTDMLLQLSSSLSENADAKTQEFFKVINSYLEYNQDLLTELHSLAKLEAYEDKLQVEDFDASTLIKDICVAANKSIPKDRKFFITHEGPDKLDVRSDPVKVSRVINNLLSNAMKYVDEGSAVVQWGLLNEKQWEIKVIDDGPGIKVRPEEALADELSSDKLSPEDALKENEINTHLTLDQGYQKLELEQIDKNENEELNNFRSNGIGLSVVKRLCEVLNATFEIYSGEGHGVAVFIKLPLQMD